MHDVVLIEHLEGVDELFEDEKGLSFGNDPLFSEHSFESAAVAVLVDEVEVVGSFEHVDILDDVLIFLDICQDVDFVDGALLQFFIFLESSHFDDLHGVLFVVELVDGSVDLTVGALSDNFVESVILDYSYHGCLIQTQIIIIGLRGGMGWGRRGKEMEILFLEFIN